MSEMTARPPRDDLVRAVWPGIELRKSDAEDDGIAKLRGHFSVFNEWTEIHSLWEGDFLERVAPGAYKKTFRENREGMRVLFQHGRDPQIGDKPLGPIQDLREDDIGAYYEVPMIDTAYNRDLIPGLEAGLYGASFRFSVLREEFDEEPDASPYNPRGLPERTIKEARVMEFGPVTFPAYSGATAELASAGVRSMTDVLRDVDAMQLATPILLDEERLGRARAFITRELPTAAREERDGEETSGGADQESGHSTVVHDTHDAPPTGDAATKSHLTAGRRESGQSHLLPPKREGTSNLL